MLIRRFTTQKAIYVVVCEEELINRELENGFFVDPKYFGGVQTNLNDALAAAKEADYATLLGNNVVERAVSLGVCSSLSVIKIGDVMYAEVAKV
ncbi:MAG: DUF424 family protein [Thermoprotei archaeon]